MHQRLDRVSPLAVPILLEISRETIAGEARAEVLALAAEELIREAMGEEGARASATGGKRHRVAAGAGGHG
jgi:ATP-dependent Lhr-like helicase